MREKLVHFASMVELELDFAEEDVEFASREELKKLVKELADMIAALISSFITGNVIRNGVPTVIAGKPNSGKSTLLNAMLNEEKAIVSELEGTTRDFIEDEIHIEGFSFRFIDTAGIREARDKIEQMGIERTRQKMMEAGVIIYMFDLSAENPESISHQVSELEHLGIPFIKAGNKTDIASPALLKMLKGQPGFVFISAKLKDNLGELKKRLIDMLDLGKVKIGNTIVTNVRHYESLFRAKNSLLEVIAGIDKLVTGELLAEDIRQSIYYLGEITGEITNEDLLANIFSKFCIGK
jgi:tRNA modification GTPase